MVYFGFVILLQGIRQRIIVVFKLEFELKVVVGVVGIIAKYFYYQHYCYCYCYY